MAEVKFNKESAEKLKIIFHSGDAVEFFMVWDKILPDDVKSKKELKTLSLHLYVYFIIDRLKNTVGSIDEQIKINVTSASDSSTTQDDSDVSASKAFQESERSDKHDEEQKDIDTNNISVEITNESLNDNEISYCGLNDSLSSLNESNSVVMEMFKIFLVNNGTELSADPEFLPYFALPFIHDPANHPVFQPIFQDDWMKKVNDRLIEFLDEHSADDDVVAETVTSVVTERSSTEHNCPFKHKYKLLRNRFNKLKIDHKSVVGIANELAAALEESVKGQGVDIKETLGKCFNMYPDLFSRPEQSHIQINLSSLDAFKPTDVNFTELDWASIKQDLTEDQTKMEYKLCLLQALRWGITSDKGVEAVKEITKNDVLNCEVISSLILISTFKPESSVLHPVQEAIARLTNALASKPQGRYYLGKYIDTLTSSLLSMPHSTALDMLVATLCKLSIEKCRSRELVSRGVLEWVLVNLNNLTTSDYFQKYAVSLLQNLCMSIPSDQWAIHPNILIPTLILLVKTTFSEERLDKIMGCLYCLLKSDELNSEFMKQGLESALRSRINSTNGFLSERMQLLIEIHTRAMHPDFVSTPYDCLAENREMPSLDPEIDDNDLIHGNPCGSELLQSYLLPLQ